MANSRRPPANAFVRIARKVYNPLGFSKGYNAILWFVFDGAFLGFTLARLPYLNYTGNFCSPSATATDGAAPGECFQYSLFTYRRVGIQLHLFGILLASLFAVTQFIPVIRHKAIIVHRIVGYMSIILALIGTTGALMITSFAFGGSIETQTSLTVLAAVFLFAIAMAIYNIKRLQIEQHRAWMLRAWAYAATIVTQRIVFQTRAVIISRKNSGLGPYFKAMWCQQILALNQQNPARVLSTHPSCVDSNAYALVPADTNGFAETAAAALELTFGMGIWLALGLHAIGIEIYLRLTPAETERLRKVSYQKQLERGFRHPGSAGLTVDRCGDSEKWSPPSPKRHASSEADNEQMEKQHDELTGLPTRQEQPPV